MSVAPTNVPASLGPTRRRFLRAVGTVGLGVALGAAPFGAACRPSQTPRSGQQAVAWPLSVGAVQISRVVETEAPMALPAGWFPMATDEAVNAERSWLEPRFIDPESGRLIFSTVRIRSEGAEAIVGSDVMHHPLQCAYPEWQSEFEVDPELSRRTRLAFLEQYAGTETLVVPAHFPTPSAGRVIRHGGRFRFAITG